MTGKERGWMELLGALRAFLYGVLGGLLAPTLAMVGSVAFVYGLTRQLPAIKEVKRADGTRGKAIVLADQAEARASWVRFGADLRGTMLELRARR